MKNRITGFGRSSVAVAVLLCMLLSIFAPTVLAVGNADLDAQSANVQNNSEKKPLVYVSIGDSMTNGYGLPGYDGESGIVNYGINTYANQFAAWLAGYTGEIADDQVIFEGTNGVVDHRQLAMSGLLAEDLHWLLDLDYSNQEIIEGIKHVWDRHSWGSGPHHAWYATSEDNRNTLCPDESCNFCRGNKCCPALGFTSGFYRTYGDLCAPKYRMADGMARMIATYMHPQGNGYGYYTSDEAIKLGVDINAIYNAVKNNPSFPDSQDDTYLLGNYTYPWRDGDNYNYNFLKMAGEFYQESVRDADIISLALGNTNFGTLMFDFIQDAISDPNDDGFTGRYFFSDIYDHMMDPTVYTPELKAEIEKLMAQVDAMIEANFDAEMFEGLETIKYIIRYCVLSYIVNYIAVVNNILKVNPDVQLIQVALMNAYEGASAGEDDGSLSMADMIDMLYNPLNAFIAAVPSLLKNGGQYPESKFYYADMGTVETLTAVFGDDFYYDSEGESISYPGLVLDKIGSVNTNSVVRDRFQYWISGRRDGRDQVASHFYFPTGGDCSYGEMWKHVLDELFVRNTHHYHTDSNCGVEGEHRCVADLGAPDFFGKYDLMYMVPEDLVAFSQLTEDQIREKLTGSDKKEADWAFTIMMYLMFENALIVAGEQSFTINGLSECKFNYTAFDGAFSAFAQELYGDDTLDYTAISSNEIPEGVDVLDVFRAMSDALVADPVASSVLCIGSRMEIGTGIGGHPSQGGHDTMFAAIKQAYVDKHTGADELGPLVDVYGYLASNGYLSDVELLEFINFAFDYVVDEDISDEDMTAIVEYIYDVLLDKDVNVRVEIVKNVCLILKDDYLGRYSSAVDVIFEIYDALVAEGLLTSDEAFSIVDLAYNKVIDGTITNEEIFDIALYVYEVLFINAPVTFSLCAAADDVATEGKAFKAFKTIINVLNGSELVTENAQVAAVAKFGNTITQLSEESFNEVMSIGYNVLSSSDLSDQSGIDNALTQFAEEVKDSDVISGTDKLIIADGALDLGADLGEAGFAGSIGGVNLPDLGNIIAILDILKEDGYITEAQITAIVNKALSVLVSGELDSAAIADIINYAYDVAAADLAADAQAKLVLAIYAAAKEVYDFDEQDIAQFISDYYDDAFEYAYKYAYDKGYIDVAVDALDTAISAIEIAIDEVNAFDCEIISAALKAAVIDELYAAIATIEKAQSYLDGNAEIKFTDFVEFAKTFESDVTTHLENAEAVLEIAGNDAIDYVTEKWENEWKDKVDNLIEAIEEKAIGYVLDAINELGPLVGEFAWELILNTPENIKAVIEFIETYGPYVEEFFEEYGTGFVKHFGDLAVKYGIEALEAVLGEGSAALELLAELVEEYGDKAWAIIEAYVEIIGYTADARWALDYALDEIYAQIDALEELLATLEAELPNLEEALLGAVGEAQDKLNEQIEALNLKIDEIKELIAELRAEAEAILKEIAEIAEATKLVAEAIIELAKAIESGITEAIKAAIDDLKIAIDNLVSVVGEAEKLIGYLADFAERIADVADKIADGLEYIAKALAEIVVSINEITEALAELEEKLDGIAAELAKKAAEFSAKAEESANKLAECARKLADKITEAVEAIKELFENATKADYELNLGDSYYVAIGDSAVDGQYASYAEVLAELLGMKKGYNFSDFTGGELGFTIEEAIAALAANGDIIAGADLITVNYGRIAAYANINKDVANWEAILGADAAEKIEALIEYIIAEVESLIADTTIGMFIDAESLVELVETYVYAQVARMVTIHELVEKLHEIAPEALVVIVGAYNEFDGVVIEIADNEIALGEYFAAVTDIINASFYACALFNEQTIFVSTDGIETQVQANGGKITTDDMSELVNLFMNPTELKNYFVPSEAGNVDIANRILAALNIVVKDHEHVYGYVCDATCNLCGAVRGVVHTYDNACDNDCNFCGTTRVVGDHVYSAACDANCDICGAVRTNAAAHNFGAWQTVRQPSYNVMGIKTRTCADCGYVQAGIIDVLVLGEAEEEAPVGLIVGITIPSVIALAAGGFSIYWFAYKKKSFKDLANVFAKMLAKFKK